MWSSSRSLRHQGLLAFHFHFESVLSQESGVARRGSDGEIGRNRVWLEQGCGRTFIDKLGSSLSLLGDTFRTDMEEEMRSWPLGQGPSQALAGPKHVLLNIRSPQEDCCCPSLLSEGFCNDQNRRGELVPIHLTKPKWGA